MDKERFDERNSSLIKEMAADVELANLSKEWFRRSSKYEYSYHFTWLGLPIIQFPTDVLALQEIVWKTQPDLIVETGIARGGSLIFYASLMELYSREGVVIGIDIDLRAENEDSIKAHPLSRRIKILKGSSTDNSVVSAVFSHAARRKGTMVVLDSDHSHGHVLKELEVYSPLVTKNNYLVVMDTVIEELGDDLTKGRPWGKGNNSWTAVREFLEHSDRFEIDEGLNSKLLISASPGGYLRCTKD